MNYVAAVVLMNLFSTSNTSDKSGVDSDKVMKIKQQDSKLLDLLSHNKLTAFLTNGCELLQIITQHHNPSEHLDDLNLKVHLNFAQLIAQMTQEESQDEAWLYFWALSTVCAQECSLYQLSEKKYHCSDSHSISARSHTSITVTTK